MIACNNVPWGILGGLFLLVCLMCGYCASAIESRIRHGKVPPK